MLSSKTNALLTHTLASFWRKQSCISCYPTSRISRHCSSHCTGISFVSFPLMEACVWATKTPFVNFSCTEKFPWCLFNHIHAGWTAATPAEFERDIQLVTSVCPPPPPPPPPLFFFTKLKIFTGQRKWETLHFRSPWNKCPRDVTHIGFSWVHDRHRSILVTWWRHQMETFSALLVLCAGNSLVADEFPSQRLVTRSFLWSAPVQMVD